MQSTLAVNFNVRYIRFIPKLLEYFHADVAISNMPLDPLAHTCVTRTIIFFEATFEGGGAVWAVRPTLTLVVSSSRLMT